jgi:chromosomal replication initiation ATPase DnaA
MIRSYGSLQTPERCSNFIELCCSELNLSCEIVRSKSRQRDVVRPRQVLMYFLNRIAGITQSDTGKLIGDFDHATVIYATKTVANDLEQKYYDVVTTYNKVNHIYKSIINDNKDEIIADFEKCTTVFNPIKHD